MYVRIYVRTYVCMYVYVCIEKERMNERRKIREIELTMTESKGLWQARIAANTNWLVFFLIPRRVVPTWAPQKLLPLYLRPLVLLQIA
jgi:hypothetical protein